MKTTQSESLKPIINILNLPACRNIAATLLRYLNLEEIIAISQASRNSKQENYFLHLVQNSYFISQFINKTDMSLYFTFYGEEEYKKIEIQQIAAIAQEKSNVFLDYHKAFKDIMKMLQMEVPVIVDQFQALNNLLVDPDLPLPKLKRETQGMFCSSPFQLFLVDCTFKQNQQEQLFCFTSFQSFLSTEKEEQYLKQFMSILKGKHNTGGALRKIMKVRYTPFEVNSKNHSDFLIKDNELHNFIVGLFALTDVMVQATHTFISLINDPLHRLVELLLRYNIFRNYVLAVEDYLSFAFKMYENIYHDSIEQDPKKPSYKFWRPAMTKWFLRMDHLHSEGMETYMYCLTKLRNKKICQNIGYLCSVDQLRYGKILNKMELNPYQYSLAEKIFDGHYNTSSEIGLFFDEHPENYQIVVMQFNEYLMDISVNQQTVHWCGHSDQQVEQPYLLYQQKLISLNKEYIHSLIAQDNELSNSDKHQIIKMDIEYLSILQVKNRTLKKIVDFINQDHELQGEHELLFDFDGADHKLQFFNNKAFILAQVDENQRPFFSIPPLCSPEKLIDMLDTNDSSYNSESSNFQYRSEEEAEDKEILENIRHNEHFEDEQPYQDIQNKKESNKKGLFTLNKFFVQDYDSQSSSPIRVKCLSFDEDLT